MEAFDELFRQANERIHNGIARADAECRRAIAAQFVQATWRLNEAEHELQFKALGYFSQWFFYPYGSRRNAQSQSHYDQKDYLASLPIEHRGFSGQLVDLKWDRGH